MVTISRKVERVTSAIIAGAGSNVALIVSFLVVLGWAVAGFFVRFSARWVEVISVLSSIIAVLMVFLIQKTQNKDSLAIQLKLNELVAAHESASNRLVNVEGMTEEELKVIQKYYTKLSDFAKKQETLTESHSIDEKREEHQIRKELEDELREISGEEKMPPQGGK